jgi:hypothetical protein
MRGFYNFRMNGLPLLIALWVFMTGSALAQVVQYDKPDRERFLLQGAKKEGEVMIYT